MAEHQRALGQGRPARVGVCAREGPLTSALLEHCRGVGHAIIHDTSHEFGRTRRGALQYQSLRAYARGGHIPEKHCGARSRDIEDAAAGGSSQIKPARRRLRAAGDQQNTGLIQRAQINHRAGQIRGSPEGT